jgi:hypothetical protein
LLFALTIPRKNFILKIVQNRHLFHTPFFWWADAEVCYLLFTSYKYGIQHTVCCIPHYFWSKNKTNYSCILVRKATSCSHACKGMHPKLIFPSLSPSPFIPKFGDGMHLIPFYSHLSPKKGCIPRDISSFIPKLSSVFPNKKFYKRK